MPGWFGKAVGLVLALGWMALPAAAQVRGTISGPAHRAFPIVVSPLAGGGDEARACLLYTSPSPRDKRQSRMPSSA